MFYYPSSDFVTMTLTASVLPNTAATLNERFENRDSPMKLMILEQNGEGSNKRRCGTTYHKEFKLDANRFLRVHLHMLKSLYVEDSSASFIEDSKVDESEWKCIEQYLQERDGIQRMGSAVQHIHDIHKDAVKFQETVSSQDPPLSMVVTVPITSPVTGRAIGGGRLTPSNLMYRSSLMTISQATAPVSPHSLCYRQRIHDRPQLTTHFWTSRTPVNSSHHPGFAIGNGRNQGTSYFRHDGSCGNTCIEKGNPFGIVSGLLKRKYQCASKCLSNKSAPYQSLSLKIHSRIHSLGSRLKDYADMTGKAGLSHCLAGGGGQDRKLAEGSVCSHSRAIFGTEFIAMGESADESKVRMETKVKLWTALYFDLKASIE